MFNIANFSDDFFRFLWLKNCIMSCLALDVLESVFWWNRPLFNPNIIQILMFSRGWKYKKKKIWFTVLFLNINLLTCSWTASTQSGLDFYKCNFIKFYEQLDFRPNKLLFICLIVLKIYSSWFSTYIFCSGEFMRCRNEMNVLFPLVSNRVIAITANGPFYRPPVIMVGDIFGTFVVI